ncbi:hypothetical protein MHEI_11160 [Mycobacterium heidelbergense]|uniref:DUF4226 domain-containing protein n=2 Tax=Mycobacterium heidelbergense TaxID=53376 RepID=UPI0009F1BC3D|nr:hypothetical protein MHEI_11160 [Mycobacterium heidelbergense]
MCYHVCESVMEKFDGAGVAGVAPGARPPTGAATFAKFLAAKAQDINRVVTETAERSRTGAAT